ncbi:uncharacterized protein GVI51_D02167 [Nakaseomyces glabratus]|uniref:Protein MNE1 n=1 Tax=Candida glabrata (strain ATCC 2001 / BCRC 20586 / JCM 3761 / NBRC 0622 / NRRL Y-65 / CBS 138) TaxID=284593 RepID=Q6FW83_CANGA|nr:uncharacterized protein CAGL0D02222g [Nakaseomyces glabratus]KAH7608248.1 hypothetical protein J7293_00764 [Nakaseomyces glabratus]KAH7608364.1 hypothetical protein J7294_00763 [Nakaseomyces glabratus]QHS65145.1 uncharacterized protein GVI51_D02167 [Nakaseomyces glabratus]CAG58422.1 unnamed protein product [Nakaseomyces glabratus]|eukprot:XP_445511.1 uncharacterized protein CAGL0D02222g [[Candida] glabrata]
MMLKRYTPGLNIRNYQLLCYTSKRYQSDNSISKLVTDVFPQPKRSKFLKVQYDTRAWITKYIDFSKLKEKDDRKDHSALDLSMIIKKLQQLRNENRRKIYFRVLTLLNTSNIDWIANSGKTLKGRIPKELYHECIKMLKNINNRIDDEASKVTFAKLGIGMIKSYKRMESGDIGNFKQNERGLVFYRDCLQLISKADSKQLYNEVIKELNSEEYKLLKIWFQIAWYLHTKQNIELKLTIQTLVSSIGNDDVILNNAEKAIFIPILIKSLAEFITCNNPDGIRQLAHIFTKWEDILTADDKERYKLLSNKIMV